MNTIHNFGLLFKNNIGLVSRVSKHIYEKDGNIIHSNMIKVGNYFAFDIEASLPSKNNITFDDFIFNKPKKKKLKTENFVVSNIKLYCSDNSGIIHSTSQSMEELECDILKIHTSVNNAPFSGIPLFNMDMEFLIDTKYSEKDIENKLNRVKDKYNCEIEIFQNKKIIPTFFLEN